MKIQAIIFDMDGTITLPHLNFSLIRQEAGLKPDGDLISQINALETTEHQQKVWDIIHFHEQQAEENQTLQEGFLDLMNCCKTHQIKTALLTRNLRKSVNALCEKFSLEFDLIITREFPQVKPHPGPILHILEQLSIAPIHAIMVGDYLHDIECGNRAGTHTCFFQNPNNAFHGQEADLTVHSMHELKQQLFTPPAHD